MWIVLQTEDDLILEVVAGELSRRADFQIENAKGDELDDFIGGEFGTYQPGKGVHIISTHHHWLPILNNESMFEAEWRYAEMFLASRGAIVVVLDESSDLERLYRTGSAVRYGTGDENDMIGAARSHEAFAEPLRAWKHYIGNVNPERLIICPPDRLTRLQIIGDLDEDEWMSVGIASGATSVRELKRLYRTLGSPTLYGYGSLPGAVENWIETNDGVFSGFRTSGGRI